jgi:hypothetical protein
MELINNNTVIKQRIKVLTFLFLLAFTKSWGQTILVWDFTSGNSASINLPGGATTISSSGITVATTGCTGNGYGGSGWNVGDYIQIPMPTSGYAIGTFTFSVRSSGTGPLNFKVQYSSTGVSGPYTDLTTFTSSNGTCASRSIDFSAVSALNCNANVVIRLVFTGGEADGTPATGDAAGGGTFRLDDIALTGTSSCSGASHTVIFNTNGGTGGSMSNQTANSPTNLTSNGFTKTGCTFAGWNTAANGSGTTYADGASYSFTVDITLYAQWNCGASHIVTFNSNGGSGSMTAQTANSTTNLTNNTFTQTGCIFSGWNTAADGSGTGYTNGQSYSFAADLTLYAQWNCSPTCPYLISVVINSCDGCASEGNNEFLLLNTGSYSFAINAANVNVTYSNGPTNITSSFAAQPASLVTLNTATLNACGTTFIDVSSGGTTVPANSTLLIINKGACFTGDWSAYCGLGNVYVAFSASSGWTTTGFFGNNTTARTFVTNFSGVNSSCGATSYAYNQSGVAGTPFGFGTDGASVLFNGGSPPTYINGNGNCAPPSIILPIELIDFYATQNGSKNDIVWKIASEKDVSQYIIEKSEDGVNFYELTKVQAKNSEGYNLTYSCDDTSPNDGITYYKLSNQDNNGTIYQHKIIDIDRGNKEWKSVRYQLEGSLIIEFKNLIPTNSSIEFYDLSGRLLFTDEVRHLKTTINTQAFSEGIYFIKIQSPYKTENFKIILDK